MSSCDILDLPAPSPDDTVAYGPEPSQVGDLRLPSGTGPFPVAVVIHGGFWRATYSRHHIGPLCEALRQAGIATWSIEYRRVGEEGGGWPGTFHDVAAATDLLWTLALRYPLDLGRVTTLGHSAGGHLALWLAARPRISSGDPLFTARALRVHRAISLAGAVDLLAAAAQNLGDGAVSALMGGTPATAGERYRTAEARSLLPLGVTQILMHGSADDVVPLSLSRDYCTQALLRGDPAWLHVFSAADHFMLIDPRTPQGAEVVRTVGDCL